MAEDLGVTVKDAVGVGDAFGQAQQQKLAGIGGTLHITDEKSLGVIPSMAWELSLQTGKPIIIVVKR